MIGFSHLFRFQGFPPWWVAVATGAAQRRLPWVAPLFFISCFTKSMYRTSELPLRRAPGTVWFRAIFFASLLPRRLTWPYQCRLTWPYQCSLTWPYQCPLTWPYQCRHTWPYQCRLTRPYQCSLTWPYQCSLTWPYQCRLTWPYQCRLTWPYQCRLTWPYQCRLTWPYQCSIRFIRCDGGSSTPAFFRIDTLVWCSVRLTP